MMQRFLKIGWQIGTVHKVESQAIQVAVTSVEGVRRRIEGCIASMSTSEARGFIRARAAQEIRRQTRILLAGQRTAASDWEARIVRQATEKVIPLVLRQCSGMPAAPFSTSMAA